MAAIILFVQGLTPGIAASQDFSLAVYGGQMTKETWFNAFSAGTEIADANIVVVAASWTFSRFWDGKLTCELEGQLGKYFGDQDNWEINLPIVGLRWHRFPWDNHLATSFALGIGPSYATQVPEVEIEIGGESHQWLIHWYGELTFGPPASSWEVLLRLHHRSSGFGLVVDAGGSNTLSAGIRYRF
jgi:hypothetical protein